MPTGRCHAGGVRGRSVVVGLVLAVIATGAGCDDGSGSGGAGPTTQPVTSTTTSTTAPRPRPVCGNPGSPPHRYEHVVVFAFENRTWESVDGPGFGPAMPYLHRLGRRCAWFRDWTEADTTQNSLSQYVAQVTGEPQPATVNDCSPSESCSTTADNLFRQARVAGLTAVNYVEGAVAPCSAAGNAAKHVPALYLAGADDRAHCEAQVRPWRDFDPANLPDFAFVTPDLCNDGHDCGNDVVDEWARVHIGAVLGSAAYAAGKVAVFVWYDEDRPVPNMWVAPTARPGPIDLAGASYAGTLAAWQEMLGLPCLARACDAPDMRAAANA
jgi:hypothetical protein